MATYLEEYYEDEDYLNSLGESLEDETLKYLFYLANRSSDLFKKGDIRSSKIVADKGRSISEALDRREEFLTLI